MILDIIKLKLSFIYKIVNIVTTFLKTNKRIKKTKLTFMFVKKFANNWVKFKFRKRLDLEPVFAMYLITKKCNFRCTYCYAESNKRISAVSPKDLNTTDTFKLIEIIRKDVSHIYFTGGEPLLRKDIIPVLKYCRDLDYDVLALTTNGSLLPKYEKIIDYLDFLTISIDSFDEKKNDQISGVKSGTTKKIKEIIKEYAELQKHHKFTLLLNTVITPINIQDTYAIMDFCFERNIGLSVIGQMSDFKPIDFLRTSPEYMKLVSDIIEYNKKGYPVLGMPSYNKSLLTFERHRCFPTLIPTIYPNGDLLYPCEVLNKRRYNLLEIGSISDANMMGLAEVGYKIDCPGQCYLPCYISASCFMEKPFSAIKQGIRLKMGNCYNKRSEAS
ncbi:MAG: radical SAM protein [Spirochaetales bacterium]|nr:radical SAM protein [Spirochaetales bacterium]